MKSARLNSKIYLMTINKWVNEFFSEYFKSTYDELYDDNEMKRNEVIYLLSILLSDQYSFPSKTAKMRRYQIVVKSWMKVFNSSYYKRFFAINGVWELFSVLHNSGYISKIIDSYPKLSSSKDSYLKIAKNIINFDQSGTLLKSNIRKC